MYYSSGNYEAFARPRKPEGVDRKSAYIIGSGLAALAAARPRGEQLFTGSLLGLKYFFASFGARMADTRTLRGLSCPGDLLSRPDLCAGLERWGRDWAARLAEARP